MNNYRRGFTIIETMLVLAITGLVASVILAGIGVNLRNEQYRTAVDQIVDYFQGQYTRVTAVQNDRSTGSCSTAGIATGDDTRGQSNCFIVGRILKKEPGAPVIKSYPAVALNEVTSAAPGEDAKVAFINSRIVLGSPEEPYDVSSESGVKLTDKTGNDPGFTILIARSPVTGRIHTYVMSGAQATLNLNSFEEQEVTMCVNSNGLLNSGITPSAIRIEKYAANASGVSLLGQGECN